jgi:hypothetical protein
LKILKLANCYWLSAISYHLFLNPFRTYRPRLFSCQFPVHGHTTPGTYEKADHHDDSACPEHINVGEFIGFQGHILHEGIRFLDAQFSLISIHFAKLEDQIFLNQAVRFCIYSPAFIDQEWFYGVIGSSLGLYILIVATVALSSSPNSMPGIFLMV